MPATIDGYPASSNWEQLTPQQRYISMLLLRNEMYQYHDIDTMAASYDDMRAGLARRGLTATRVDDIAIIYGADAVAAALYILRENAHGND